MRSPLEQFDIINVKSFYTSFIDLSINNILVPFIFFIFVIVSTIWLFNNKFNIIPNYYQNFLESLYSFIINLIKQQAHDYGLF
jgi:F0F1-type ATP synthase membrane subunit a